MADIDLRPPEGVRNAARRGLALRREFGRGGTAVGVARARDLSRGANISPSTIRRMMSYFARHGSYAKDPDPSAPSTGYIAWMLWGGDAGKRWARAMAERLDKAGKAITMTKAADGLRLMLIVTTNAYQDREGEIVTRKALEDDTDRRWEGGRFVQGDPVVYWHDDPEQHPDRIIGDVVYANMHGDFLVEVAKERPTDYARRVWDFVQKGDRAWGASHGFQYRAGEKAQGEYSFTRKFETSILPLQNAANEYTFAGVLMSDAQQAERQALLDQILGEGTSQMVNQKTAQKGKKLDKAGVRRKEMDAAAKPEEKPADEKMMMPEEKKAMTAEQVADQAMAIAASEGDEAAKRQALIDLINAVMGAGEDVKETDDMGEMEDEYAEDEEAVKAFKAFADGVQAAQEKQAAGLSEVQKRLAELPTIIQRLDARFKALEGKLAMTPRAASRAAETEVTDPALLERVKAQTEKVDPFWGVKVKGE